MITRRLGDVHSDRHSPIIYPTSPPSASSGATGAPKTAYRSSSTWLFVPVEEITRPRSITSSMNHLLYLYFLMSSPVPSANLVLSLIPYVRLLSKDLLQSCYPTPAFVRSSVLLCLVRSEDFCLLLPHCYNFYDIFTA